MGLHDDALGELNEWFEDVCELPGNPSVGAQCVVFPAPTGWGRTSALDALLDHANAERDTQGIGLPLPGADAPDGLLLQATWLPKALGQAAQANPLLTTLGVDSPVGVFDRSLGLADASGIVGGRAGSIAAFLGSLGVDVMAHLSGEEIQRLAEIDRLAWRIARWSRDFEPIALVIDDAERFDDQILDRFVTGLIEPLGSRVLVVVAGDPNHENVRHLLRPDRYGPARERIQPALDVDGTMGFDARLELARELAADWPPDALHHLAAGTASFGQVFGVVSLPAAVDVPASDDPTGAVDALVAAVTPQPDVSRHAAALAWVGGWMHAEIDDRLVELDDGDWPSDIRRFGQLVRLSDSVGLDRALDAARIQLAATDRTRIADLVVEGADAVVRADPSDPIELIGLLQPVWVLADRAELEIDQPIAALLTTLAETRLAVGDRPAARAVAERVAAWCSTGDRPVDPRVLQVLDRSGSDAAGRLPPGTIVGTEARVRHCATLLSTPGSANEAMASLDSIVAEIDALPSSPSTNEWRLLLAYRLVRSGHAVSAGEVLAPLLAMAQGEPDRRRAELVMSSVGNAGELLLQRAALYERYQELTDDSPLDDRLPVVDALVDVSDRLGDWRTARDFSESLLAMRTDAHGPDHPVVLSTRSNYAHWTGQSGDPHQALHLHNELLDDRTRILGPDHPHTLGTRNNVAGWAGESGDPDQALHLYNELLPDLTRILGPDHPDTFTTRNNIAELTGQAGDPDQALHLHSELLDDRTRVLGPDHPHALTTRNNIAQWAAHSGDPHQALHLYNELLPDLTRILGPDHPHTLATRNNVAALTGQAGDPHRALHLYSEMLPDVTRILGPDHPRTLTTRNNIAELTDQAGDPHRALHLHNELLDDRTRLLEPDHPDTLTTRKNIDYLRRQIADSLDE